MSKAINTAPIISVVISGGEGSRLWPVSRLSLPKPFIKLTDGRTLIERAYERAKKIGCKILTVTNREYYFICKDELERVGASGCFLLEPFARNTAPAIALAAEYISATHGAETMMLVFAADQMITDQEGLFSAVSEATKLAEEDYLVTFGIVPTRPETGYGYIELGETLQSGYRVARFVEKPNLATAISYVSSSKFLWNSGMFCFKARVFLAELAKHAPRVAQEVKACWIAMQQMNCSNLFEIPPDLFKNVQDISIDYAVLEKSDKVTVVPGDFGWADIGSWNAIRDLVQPDGDQNRALCDAIFLDTSNTFVQSEDRLVATVGIKDLIIIDTADALLVAHTEKVQDVKKIVAQLKSHKHDAFQQHRTVSRPWGTYTIIEEAPCFKIKRIEVKPGASLSLQLHRHRSEHWIVVNGTAKITNGDQEILIHSNQSTYIPIGQKHRLENPGVIPCVIIEVQCGSYLGEDDIVRFEDNYGRAL